MKIPFLLRLSRDASGGSGLGPQAAHAKGGVGWIRLDCRSAEVEDCRDGVASEDVSDAEDKSTLRHVTSLVCFPMDGLTQN